MYGFGCHEGVCKPHKGIGGRKLLVGLKQEVKGTNLVTQEADA